VPAVLRIAASTSSQSGQSLGRYVGQLSGPLRPVGAYLAEMVDSLPRDMALFMLHTAVLDRFSAPLCQAVTQQKSSRELLDSIASRQLLLVPLDHDGRWYRYHTLLTAHLRQRLEAERGRPGPGRGILALCSGRPIADGPNDVPCYARRIPGPAGTDYRRQADSFPSGEDSHS